MKVGDLFIFASILFILLLFSAFFSASETALFSLPSPKIKAFRFAKNPRKRLIAQLLSQPRDLLVTVFMMNTLVNIVFQNVSSGYFGESAGWLWKVGLPLVLILVLGEVIPKYVGLQENTQVAISVAPWIDALQKLVGPLRRMIVAITAPVSRVLFFYLKPEESISSEELQHALKASEAQGVLDKDEAELLSGYLNLQDSLVKELMRPREDVLFYDIEDPLSKLNHLFVDEQCSRLPVCEGDLDHIIGIINAQVYFLQRHQLEKPQDLIQHLQKPFFIPESTPAELLLRRFDEQDEVIALVVDEYGSITGLIGREDLIEVVIGEISDQRDQRSLYTKTGPNEIIATGKMDLEELNDIFHTQLESENNLVTVAGWVIEKIGEIPKSGSKYKLDDYFFHILSADPKRINRLFIRYEPSNRGPF